MYAELGSSVTVGVLGARLVRDTVADPDAESPDVSLTVTEQDITSLREAMLLSNVRVAALPKDVEVLSFIH